MAFRHIFGIMALCQAAFVAGISWAIPVLDAAYPPPLERAAVVSREVQDRNGKLLRAFATPEGRWRLRTRIADVDPQFVKMLIAYEDQRFSDHGGIDPYALLRAGWQLTSHARIVSGGSTLSMQVARLIEPRQGRSLSAKIRQMVRAIQIERRWSKDQILEAYLNLAPYGGNLEGVRAASLAYFGKEPRRLNVGESALLVALPQLPEKRRPDRYPQAAKAARERVLGRMAVARVIGEGENERAELVPIPERRLALPALSPHLAQAALKKMPAEGILKTTLKREVQSALEGVARDAAEKLGPRLSVAIVMADSRTGDIIAEVGSSDYFDTSRAGFIDMTRTLRSPGSTLKPFIFGLAFEEGIIAQETIIEDRPSDFSGYRPRNFDMTYQGDVTIRTALQMSLNVPAVKLLEAVSPARLLVRFRRADVNPVLPTNEQAGLAIALGGAGMSLRDLVQLYAGLANRGKPVRLGDGIREVPAVLVSEPIMDRIAAWQVTDILAGMRPPQGAGKRGIAYKTGTSYGYRDAWSVGYDGRHVIGVWVGRADNGAVPGIAGYTTAAPILFEAFQKSGVAIVPFPKAPAGALRLSEHDLPAGLKRYARDGAQETANVREPAPRIVYPPEGARVELGLSQTDAMPLLLKLQGGRPPFRWLANGEPLPQTTRKRQYSWSPDSSGYSTLTVIDAVGRAASVKVFLD